MQVNRGLQPSEGKITHAWVPLLALAASVRASVHVKRVRGTFGLPGSLLPPSAPRCQTEPQLSRALRLQSVTHARFIFYFTNTIHN